jgi:hypothetical protein
MTLYMASEGSQWHTLLECNRDTPTLEEFVKLVNRCFGPPFQSNTLSELIHLCRDGSVADYQSKFLSLLGRCDGLAEGH